MVTEESEIRVGIGVFLEISEISGFVGLFVEGNELRINSLVWLLRNVSLG